MVEWLSEQADSVKITGVLTQHSLEKLQSAAALLRGLNDSLQIDLSALEHIDSAGVAFLLELQAYAHQVELKINFVGATNSLNKLKSLYNLDTII